VGRTGKRLYGASTNREGRYSVTKNLRKHLSMADERPILLRRGKKGHFRVRLEKKSGSDKGKTQDKFLKGSPEPSFASAVSNQASALNIGKPGSESPKKAGV